MIVILRPGCARADEERLVAFLAERGLQSRVIDGAYQRALALLGDVSGVNAELIASFDGVESVKRVSEQYRLCSRKHQPFDKVVEIGGVKLGGGHFAVIAGPCAVESEEQIVSIARSVKAAGADLLRGGAFKPRTSPYDFSGLGREGLALLKRARAETGLPIVSEIMSASDLPLFEDVDVLQVGARNMQNFELLRALGRLGKPVLLKRGLAATLRELLLSAEYILAGGNENVILCERGVRGFDEHTRATLDLSAVPALHELTQLPVIVDPSHAVGRRRLVPPMALAAAACGADGLLLEVHNDPAHALSDGAQALPCEDFSALCARIRAVREAARP